MLLTQQLKDYSNFLQESRLKKLVLDRKVSIVYIHGTARSGSTIAEIILAQLADLAIHQPFRGTLQKAGGRFRATKLDFDADIYDLGCGSIVEQINQCLETKDKITVVVKELAGFFKPCIWQRWIEIPDKFLFTIREPHLQYMSWLSAMTDKVFEGGGKLQENRDLVLSKAEITETSVLSAEWEGTTLSCNQAAWNALVEDFDQVKNAIANTDKKLAILDSVLLRYNPELAIKNTIAKLCFAPDKLSNLNFDSLSKSKEKVWDIRDKSRPMVKKANSSNTINPLTLGEAISLDVFPSKSQEHIQQIVPLYLDLLYAPEQVYLPDLTEVEIAEDSKLIITHPFMTYAIAIKNFHSKQQPIDVSQVLCWLESQIKNKERKTANYDSFASSFSTVDSYWEV